MLDIGVELLERIFVEQHQQPLARGQLALGMLGIDTLLPASQSGGGAAAFHFVNIGGHSASPVFWSLPSAPAAPAMQMRICKVAKLHFAK
jgi:hypothetical protein